MNPRVTSFADAVGQLPTPDGRRSMFIVDDPNLALKLYAPRGTDPQTPHARDEIYIIAQGTAEFTSGAAPCGATACGAAAPGGDEHRVNVSPGDVLFAAAGVPHRFENFSDDFATWVMFYGPPVLYTDRLVLRMMSADDFEAYARIHGDDETQRYLQGRGMTRDESYRSFSMLLGQWRIRGYGMWGVYEKETNELVGRVGFFHPDGWPGFEIAWTIARDRWGRGYATEAARRALRYAFEDLGQKHVISVIHPDNAASIAVAKKLGETFERETEVMGRRAAIYGIDA